MAWDKNCLLKIQLASHAVTRNLGQDQCNGIFAQWVESVGVGFCQKALVTAALEPLLSPPSAPLTDPSIVWEFLAKTATHNKSNASGSPAAGRRRTTAWLAVAAARTTYLLLPSFSPLPCGIRRGPFCKYDGETGSLHDRARSISDAFPAHYESLFEGQN